MRFFNLLLLSNLIVPTAFSAQKISCTHYVYSGVPFVTIVMNVNANGHIERLAEWTHYGSTQQTAVEENEARTDQLYNLTIDADRPGNELFLEIYKSSTNLVESSFKAKLINPQSPAMKEMAGQCDLTGN